MSSINKSAQLAHTYEMLIGCMMLAKHRLIEIAGENNITGMQAMMLIMLKEPSPMNSFTKVFNCDASNITGIVDGLEKRGLAARFPLEKDRRIKMIKLSADGEKLRQHFAKLLIEDKESNLFRLEDSELEIFNKLLKKITSPLNA